MNLLGYVKFLSKWRERRVHLSNNVHCLEGHLGGYIKASPHPAPSGLRVDHGDPETWTPALWRWGVERLGIRSVLDVGCGEAHAAQYFRELGCEVCAVDGSKQAKRDSRVPDAHVIHDFASGPWTPDRSFDLLWSCEFVEHVESRYEENFLATFEAAKYVMMTYASPGQPGWHHVNCQTAAYWAYRMHQHRFVLNDGLTAESRRVSDARHYRNRGLVFERNAQAA